MKTIAFLLSFAIGFAILVIDLWFHNGWPVPRIINDSNNLKLGLAALFLTLIFVLAYLAFVAPPRFGRANAKQAFQAIHHFVARGNPDHLLVISDWLGNSASKIVKLAAERDLGSSSRGGNSPFGSKDYAAYILSLLGSRKLCREMVDKSPWAVAALFTAASNHKHTGLPITQFARNVGTELVTNEQSALYTEDDGYSQGLLGYTKPITTTVYGNFDLVEELATAGGCPLDIDLLFDLSASQLEAYTRAIVIFSDSYFAQRYPHHSYAFVRSLSKIEFSSHDLQKLDGLENYYDRTEFRTLKVVVRFSRKLIEILAKHPIPVKRKVRDHSHNDGLRAIYLSIAEFIFKFIEGASSVRRPAWTSWVVQHNTLIADLFSYDDSPANKLIRFHLRRLFFDRIKEMDGQVNFVAARIVGLSLNVFGLAERAAGNRRDRDFAPVRRAAVAWAKNNYLTLVREYPAVAEACLSGGITFDAEQKRLVKTYSSMLGQEPRQDFLELVEKAKG